MGRCPKHPEYIQSGNTCMAWVCKNKWVDNFRCGETLEPLSSDELIEKTTLPPWIITVIKSIAYEEFHSYGQREVDSYISDWIGRFERAQNCPSSVEKHS